MAINSLLGNITEAIEEKKKTNCIFLDFAKAFDTVNHQILLKKLHYYGIRGHALKWFESYLSERKQCVSIGNTKSEIGMLSCGVLQGSILGPLLFLLYINDITKSSNLLKFLLFADAIYLSYSIKPNENPKSIINEELQKVTDWLVANRLPLNVDKSHFLTNKQKRKV